MDAAAAAASPCARRTSARPGCGSHPTRCAASSASSAPSRSPLRRRIRPSSLSGQPISRRRYGRSSSHASSASRSASLARPAQPQDLGAMDAAAPMQTPDRVRLAPPLHRVGPLLGDVVLREPLQRADELAIDHARSRADRAPPRPSRRRLRRAAPDPPRHRRPVSRSRAAATRPTAQPQPRTASPPRSRARPTPSALRGRPTAAARTRGPPRATRARASPRDPRAAVPRGRASRAPAPSARCRTADASRRAPLRRPPRQRRRLRRPRVRALPRVDRDVEMPRRVRDLAEQPQIARICKAAASASVSSSYASAQARRAAASRARWTLIARRRNRGGHRCIDVVHASGLRTTIQPGEIMDRAILNGVELEFEVRGAGEPCC